MAEGRVSERGYTHRCVQWYGCLNYSVHFEQSVVFLAVSIRHYERHLLCFSSIAVSSPRNFLKFVVSISFLYSHLNNDFLGVVIFSISAFAYACLLSASFNSSNRSSYGVKFYNYILHGRMISINMQARYRFD